MSAGNRNESSGNKRLSRRSVRAMVAATIYGAFLFWINHIPQIGVSLISGTDKLAHFAAYGLLAILLAWTVYPERRGSWRGYLIIFVAAAVYATLDELLQRYVPRRTPDFQDWVADMVGVALALATHYFVAPHVGNIRGRFRAARQKN